MTTKSPDELSIMTPEQIAEWRRQEEVTSLVRASNAAAMASRSSRDRCAGQRKPQPFSRAGEGRRQGRGRCSPAASEQRLGVDRW